MLRQHQRPVGGLVEMVVSHRGQGQLRRSAGFTKRQGGGPGTPPGAAQQPRTVPPGVIEPGSRRLVGEDLTAAKQVERATGGDQGHRRVARTEVCLRL
jgi:hypothetical protein